MTIALVTSTAAQTSAKTAVSGSIDTTGANLLVLVLASYSVNAEPTITDSYGNTWVPRTAYSDAISRIRIFYVINPTVGTGHTFTADSGATDSFPAIAVAAYSGAATAAVYDVENGGTGTAATSKATGSVTPSADNSLFVAGWMISTAGQPTGTSVNSAFTIRNTMVNVLSQSFGISLSDFIQTTAAAKNPTFSWASAASVGACIAVFKVAVPIAAFYTLMGQGAM